MVSILPIFVVAVFAFSIGITARARKHQAIAAVEAGSVYLLMLLLFIWTLISATLGIKGLHTSPALLERVPLLWQACIPVFILVVHLLLSKNLRSGLRNIANATPQHWLVFFEGLRIGALGGVIKGIQGEVTSSFVFWVGIPDLLYGISALIIGLFMLKQAVGNRFLLAWNLIGPAIILLPTFVFMNYFMNEPGFIFIFQFPMVLAPSIVVPVFLFVNFLMTWRLIELFSKNQPAKI